MALLGVLNAVLRIWYQFQQKTLAFFEKYVCKFTGYKGLNTLCVLSAQYRTRSSDIAVLRSLKQCSADREYTY